MIFLDPVLLASAATCSDSRQTGDWDLFLDWYSTCPRRLALGARSFGAVIDAIGSDWPSLDKSFPPGSAEAFFAFMGRALPAVGGSDERLSFSPEHAAGKAVDEAVAGDCASDLEGVAGIASATDSWPASVQEVALVVNSKAVGIPLCRAPSDAACHLSVKELVSRLRKRTIRVVGGPAAGLRVQIAESCARIFGSEVLDIEHHPCEKTAAPRLDFLASANWESNVVVLLTRYVGHATSQRVKESVPAGSLVTASRTAADVADGLRRWALDQPGSSA